MQRDGVGFKEALKTLGGDLPAGTFTPQRSAPTQPTAKPLTLPTAEWQAEAWREVSAASQLLNSNQTMRQAGREFLASRCLQSGTWEAWHLGFTYAYDHKAKRRRPAVTIPWYDMDSMSETITAVKYRFVDQAPTPDALRYSCRKGSTFGAPFGLWDAMPGIHHTLLLIEGEFNCLSVWQCRPRGVTCLSFGAQGAGDMRILQRMATVYERVFVWADDVWSNPKQAEHAKELRALIKADGLALRSVKEDGVKHDANELLMRGALPDFLTQILGVECQSTGKGV
jgi:hypothetical protein